MPLPIPASREEIAQIQRDRKRIVVEQARAAPFHRQRLADIDTSKLDDPDEWAKIPILDKDQLRAMTPQSFQRDFNLAEPGQVAEYWRSGGSTGVPLFYARTFEDMKIAYLTFRRVFLGAGVTAGAQAHISFPLGIHPVGHMFARAAQQEGIGVNWAGAGNNTPSALQIKLIDILRPSVWMGMSGYALHLANLAEAQGVDLAACAVDKIICSAEPMSDAKRSKIEKAWGATVCDSFGMTEAGMMGAESAARDGFHIWTDLFHIEVVDEETGRPVDAGVPGLLVVTPLFTSHATPFVRWNSGDIVTYFEHGQADGPLSVFPLIKHAHRTVGFFKVRGININHQDYEDFLFGFDDVVDFKAELVAQEALDGFLVSIEVTRSGDAAALVARIVEQTRATFEVTPEIRVLDRGTLAREFEASVKAPRFVDRR
jgi:phenylacetate-CoA ligase